MTPTPWKTKQYPFTPRSNHVDIYNSQKQGEVKVPDPYRWLEENSKDTEEWTTAQQAFTRAYLDTNPDRQKLEDDIRRATDYAKV